MTVYKKAKRLTQGLCLILPALFITSVYASAVDTLSITHLLGTGGDLGAETVQLICLKNNCHLSLAIHDRETEKTTLERNEAKVFFTDAKNAIEGKQLASVETNQYSYFLDFQNRTFRSRVQNTALQSLDLRLRARLRK